ncbi:hypothetical protein SVAN01_05633 [Stagonosporopsis vannaccii]|nr:hypothetical protein SVAN01_05633 [Stagonosporopsis vannaccii]
MSAPLVDIDANPRQPGFKPTKAGSKIPNPPRAQRSGTTDRRSIFSVSTTGSPCYTAISTNPNNIMSHAPTSKLPRKSTPTQSTFSKSYTYGSKPVMLCSSLPQARGGLKTSATTVLSKSATRTTSPSLSCDKPLPSPPFAQIVNPASPAKPQRTLVDAEAGTPTDEQWPILRPESVLPSKHPALTTNDGLMQRVISEGSALQRNNVSVLRSQATTPSLCILSQQSESSTGDEASSDENSHGMTGSCPFNSENPYSQQFHALSTNNNVALNSPLAHKQQTSPVVTIPPRNSSKRDSLPLASTSTDNLTSQSSSASFRPVKSGSTKWPVLADTADTAPEVFPRKYPNDRDICSFQHHLVAEPESNQPASLADAGTIQSRSGSINSVSTWSSGAGSSLKNVSETYCEGSFRIKRLSGRSYDCGPGPVLKISADADAVILGWEESIPAVPILTEQISEHGPQEMPAGTSSGRISGHMLVKTASTSVSRTSTPSTTTQTESMETERIKIPPIRTMQTLRELSTGRDSFKSDSTSMLASLEYPKKDCDSVPPQVKPRSHFESPNDVPVSQPPEATPQALTVSEEHDLSCGKAPIAFQDILRPKPMKVLDANEETQFSASRKRVPSIETTSGSASSKSIATRSKTSPFLPSSDRLKAQVARCFDHSPYLVSSEPARSMPSRISMRQSGPSRLEAKELLTGQSEAGSCKSTSEVTEAVRLSTVDAAVKMKAKRSFRNIFHRRDPKIMPQPDKKQGPKRASATGNALSQRIRDSTNFSKVSLAKEPGVVVQTSPGVTLSSNSVEGEGAVCGRQITPSTAELTSAMLPHQPEPIARYDTATVVNRILDRVTSMRDHSSDRLRGLEIAEAILHTIECFKEAGLSAELAKKHARDAELNADRAGLELKRLAKLCEPVFDNETMQSIKQLIMAAGVGRLPDICAE